VVAWGEVDMRLCRKLRLGDDGNLLRLRVSLLSLLEFISGGPTPAVTYALPLHPTVEWRPSSTFWSFFLQASSQIGGSSAPAAGHLTVVLDQVVCPRSWRSWHGGGALFVAVEKELEDWIAFSLFFSRAFL
jgi:hypothetical protein